MLHRVITMFAAGCLMVLVVACGGGNAAPGPAPSSSTATSTRYTTVATVPWQPKPATSVDIGWVDPKSRRYFLADRTNAGVQVVNADSSSLDALIPGFTGSRGKAVSGPNGLTVVPDRNELWAGDGDGTLKVVDLDSRAMVASVALGGRTRVDELAYDASRHLVAATIPDEAPPSLTFVSATDRKVLGKVVFPDATGGIEQPAWNPTDKSIYQPITATKSNPGGEVDVIDPAALKVTRVIGLSACMPHGAAFGPQQHLLLGCSGEAIASGAHASTVVVQAPTGRLLATVSDVGGSDGVWYNPADRRYYVAAYQMTSDGTKAGTPNPVLGIIDAGTNRFISSVPTSALSHSVAVDPKTGHVFVPMSEGIVVLSAGR